jgi:hypothetical protein
MSEKKSTYILKRGTYSRFEEGVPTRYKEGDEIQLTAEEAERFAPNRLVAASGKKGAASGPIVAPGDTLHETPTTREQATGTNTPGVGNPDASILAETAQQPEGKTVTTGSTAGSTTAKSSSTASAANAPASAPAKK